MFISGYVDRGIAYSAEGMMRGVDLRPLSLGELLDRTFTLYRNQFWLFVGIMGVPQLIAVIVSLLLQGLIAPFSANPAATSPPASPAEMGKLVAGAMLGFFLLGIVYCLVYTFALGATTFAVSELYLGRAATIRAAYGSMRGSFGKLLGLILLILFVASCCYLLGSLAGIILGVALAFVFGPLAVIGMLLGFGAGVGLGIWMALRFGVAVPALLLEKAGVFQAMTRSSLLTKGHRGKVFLTFLLMGLITYVAVLIFQGPFFAIAVVSQAQGTQLSSWLNSLSLICGGVGGALSGPLLMIALSLLYYDLRMRKEAFDLQWMMATLDQTSAGGPNLPGEASERP